MRCFHGLRSPYHSLRNAESLNLQRKVDARMQREPKCELAEGFAISRYLLTGRGLPSNWTVDIQKKVMSNSVGCKN